MPKRPSAILSHWYQLIENLQTSPKEFYASVERRQVLEAERSRVDWRDGGPLSAKREYFRVKRKELALDICAAPFGTGFFVSWWLGEFRTWLLGLLESIPYLGALIKLALKPPTQSTSNGREARTPRTGGPTG